MRADVPGGVLAGGLPRPTSWSDRVALVLVLSMLPVAFLLAATGGVVAALFPLAALALAAAGGLTVLVLVRPVTAAYLLFTVTPLVAGIERGKVLPLLRPHEALIPLLAGILLLRGIVKYAAEGKTLRLRPAPVDISILLLLLTGSLVPVLWMFARGRELSQDDVLYALRLGHYAALYLIVRSCVRHEKQVATCLVLSISVACIVAIIGMLEVLGFFGAADVLSRYYALEASPGAVTRATATTGSPFAFSDVLLFNLALCVGYLFATTAHRRLLLAASGILVFGIMASGQFSALIGLMVTAMTLAFIFRRTSIFLALLLPLAAAPIVLEPVLAARISEVDPFIGLPSSWIGRFDNLTTYFWPNLFADFNYLLGVRPSPQVLGFYDWEGPVYIESGHTWLLWIGGLPFFVAFCLFSVLAIKRAMWVAGQAAGHSYRVAGIGSLCALLVVVALMFLDAHLTLRASADLSFSLLALAVGAPLCNGYPSPTSPLGGSS